nr:hybrid sensor histidine kinase/response regulator [Spirochaetales bacterium]
ISGSGLGLAITHSIIHKHGGIILADSPPGHGALFIIYLKASRHDQVEQEQETIPVSVQGKGTIMVMDDDAMIRDVSLGLLSRLGYSVILAEDGKEAIRLYQSDDVEKIDVIIMDLTIPGGMGGKDAVQEILKLNPLAKVIVSSGYSNDPIMANYAEYGFCAALDKPYQLQNLITVLERVLA